MTNSRHRMGLFGLSVSSLVLVAAAGSAMAQQPLTKEEIERRKALQQQKAQPQRQPPPVVKAPPVVRTPPIVKREAPPVVRQPPPVIKPSPPLVKQSSPPPPPPMVKREIPPPLKSVPPPVSKQIVSPTPAVPKGPAMGAPNTPSAPSKVLVRPAPTPDSKTFVKTAPSGGAPTTNAPGFTRSPVLSAPRPMGTPPPVIAGAKAVVPPPPGPLKLDQLKQGRVQKMDSKGRTLLVEPGNRTIIRQNNSLFIHRDEGKNLLARRPDARSMRLPNGITQSIYVRSDGVRVYSEFDGAGRLIRRYGRRSGGPDIVYLDNRRFYRNLAIGVGIGVVGAGLLLALSPPVHALPGPKYIVDYDRASDDDLYEAMSAPPVVRLDRAYSLDEIRYSLPLRDRMRRIDLDAITFDFGSFEISEDQYGKLERMAKVIARAIEKNPAEMFLIEGHTDAVGSDDDNLTLSDRRAEAVARVLSEYYNIPMENLTTQGYGEQFLKVNTTEAERTNRRVAFRRIGPLLGQDDHG